MAQTIGFESAAGIILNPKCSYRDILPCTLPQAYQKDCPSILPAILALTSYLHLHGDNDQGFVLNIKLTLPRYTVYRSVVIRMKGRIGSFNDLVVRGTLGAINDLSQ